MTSPQRKYTHYYLHVENIGGVNGNISDATSIPGETISKCIERFLRDILKDDRIKVRIESHNTEVKEI